MNLAEAIAVQVKPRGPKCSVRMLLETLNKDDKAVMETALANAAISHAQLARAVTDAGLGKIGQGTISRHRAGDCGCPR